MTNKRWLMMNTKGRKLFGISILATVIVAIVVMMITAMAESSTVEMCHNGFNFEANENSVEAHLAHGDAMGFCDPDAPPGHDATLHLVKVCHVPDKNKLKMHTISIRDTALKTHLDHGDYKGECLPLPPPGCRGALESPLNLAGMCLCCLLEVPIDTPITGEILKSYQKDTVMNCGDDEDCK